MVQKYTWITRKAPGGPKRRKTTGKKTVRRSPGRKTARSRR